MTRDKVSKETVEDVLGDFTEFFNRKIEKKGYGAFVSMSEITGKALEEFQEMAEEAHRKDKDKFIEEAFDLACVALFGVMSLK